jgi:hypothetical protein
VRFPFDPLGEKPTAVFIDIYGNEARVLIEASRFGAAAKNLSRVAAPDLNTKKAIGEKAKA